LLSEDQNENEYSLSYYAPKMVWLLKDFEILDRDPNGNILSPHIYME
jgi:hypothetical protein